MSSPTARAVDPVDGAALLERAVGYTRGALLLAGGSRLDAGTPCAAWDLRALLLHLHDSLAALTDAADLGYVDPVPVPDWPGPEDAAPLVDRLRSRACALLAAWAPDGARGDRAVDVAGVPLRPDLLAAAGAMELAVHGWDVARACGADRPLPAALALDLLDLVPVLVAPPDRPTRFAAPLPVPADATPGRRLLAALGRGVPR